MSEHPRPDKTYDDQDIADLVDEMEERVTAERQAEGRAGHAGERAETTAVEPEDQAPE